MPAWQLLLLSHTHIYVVHGIAAALSAGAAAAAASELHAPAAAHACSCCAKTLVSVCLQPSSSSACCSCCGQLSVLHSQRHTKLRVCCDAHEHLLGLVTCILKFKLPARRSNRCNSREYTCLVFGAKAASALDVDTNPANDPSICAEHHQQGIHPHKQHTLPPSSDPTLCLPISSLCTIFNTNLSIICRDGLCLQQCKAVQRLLEES
jgi:hypothetical protein